jgi:hypothetical protein
VSVDDDNLGGYYARDGGWTVTGVRDVMNALRVSDGESEIGLGKASE